MGSRPIWFNPPRERFLGYYKVMPPKIARIIKWNRITLEWNLSSWATFPRPLPQKKRN